MLSRAVIVLLVSGLLGAAASVRAQERVARAAELSSLAQRFAEAGDRVSARAYYRDAIAADPSFADAYVALGELELARAAYRDAESAFRVGLVRARPEPRLWIGLARALDGLGAPLDADGVLAQADHDFRDDALLLAFRASRAEERGRWSEALVLTRRLHARARRDGDTLRAEELALRARALATLVGGLDPVHAPEGQPSPLRAALASRSRD